MKYFFLSCALFLCSLILEGQNVYQYYYNSPATIWEESVPLGNGRIGMMPWGGIDRERIVLNEISLWAGSKQNADNPDAYKYLKEIRQLLFTGKNKEAQNLMYKTFTCLGKGGSDNAAFGSFQNFGNLYIEFTYPDSLSTVNDYKRTIYLNDATSTTTYTRAGISYKREYFTSFTDDIGIIRLTANKKGALSLKLFLRRDMNFKSYAQDNNLYISGQMNATVKSEGMNYSGQAKIVNKGGTLTTNDKDIVISGADEVLIYVSLATDYKGNNPVETNTELLKNSHKKYSKLRQNHIKRYKHWFDRVDVTLDKNRNSNLPINKRLEAFAKDRTDYDLIGLYMQYGRYLLISSTREGGLPPNLQGLWAPQIFTPWNGDYHLNINLQMNLWGAETGNLADLHMPLIEYTKSLVKPGTKTAAIYYNSRGWVTHILGNVWGFTSPAEDPAWGATNTAGAWLCQHLWMHYLYNKDKEYLQSVYPTMKGAALFFEDMLIRDPNNGYLVTAPTTSPENKYITTSGDTISVSAGSTMDNQIIRELFTNVVEAAKILNVDSDWVNIIESKKSRLAPTSIGKYGQIMEWLEDYEEAEIDHRHVSQLYGLYPGSEITVENTPDLINAAKTTLERRGDASTGWSMAWKINFWARLKDGNRAYKLIGDLLKPAGKGWGTYPNLFSAHPPMQIDGNFGGSAGIMEMLLQSHSGYIELLPAIPDSMQNGNIKGLKVRGGASVNFSWNNGKITTATIKADVTDTFILKIPDGESLTVSGTKDYSKEQDKLILNLKKGQSATVKF
ncbi:glycoside hydrolase family 95 protein [Dysgonomonas macrotermitis]|uniref:Alpha-L-fucosidase 2 n=1 Tax=Dysgonomonas macrotermitis TaxID=1346286 RepID=A0A1M5B0M8_9BACT|nr:glycoside hydrolase family 95 protein [Dysgonomonas macrotermitis]SHF36038.1 alpha-L-fucosidase 2 [Dysgonomonas macrotermitis]